MSEVAIAVRTWSIYCLLEGKHVRYIGITSQRPERRLLQHYADASRRRTDHKTNWIRHCLAEGIQIEIRVVRTGLLQSRAEQTEVRLLRFFRKAFRLVNSHEGGVSGYAGLSDESKAKHAAAGRNRWNDPQQREMARKNSKHLADASRSYWREYRLTHPKIVKTIKQPRFEIEIRDNKTKRVAAKFELKSLRDFQRRMSEFMYGNHRQGPADR